MKYVNICFNFLQIYFAEETKRMKRAEKKRRARKFNVCKKICQLNRVATLFSIQYQEQAFQRQYLSDFYSAKISEILNEAWNKSEDCYNKINAIYPEIRLKYKQVYGKKYKEITIDINVFIQSTGEMIARRLQNVSKQIENKANEIISINEKIDKYHNPNYESELFDGFVNNLNSLVKIQKQRYNAQKNKIYSTLNSKVSLLKNESDARIQRMNTEKDIQKGLIKSAFPQNLEYNELFRSFLNDFLIPYRKRFKNCHFSLTSTEFKFLGTKSSFEKSFLHTKNKIFNEIDKMKLLHKKFHAEKKESIQILNRNLPDDIKNDSIESIQNEMMTKIEKFQKEEEELKKKLFESHQKFDNKIQFLELNQKGRSSNFETIFVELQTNQSNEINSLKLKNSQIEKITNDRICQIEKEINEFITIKSNTEKNISNQILEIRNANLDHLNKIEKEFENEKSLLIHEFQQRKNEIQKKNSQLTCDLKNLENEKSSIITRFHSYYNSIDNDEKKEIKNLKNNFNFSISELRNDFSNKLDKLNQNSNDEINKIKTEFQNKKNEKIRQLEFMYNQEILNAQFNIENSNTDKNYLKEINNYYLNIFNEYQDKLNSIEPPSFNDTYAHLTVEYSRLSKQLNDSIEIISKEKQKLNELYNSRIEREKERNLNKIKEQEEMLKILSQIENVRKEKESKINKLICSQNNNNFDDEIQKEFKQKLDLIELNYLNQKSLKLKQIESLKNEIISQKEALKNSIDELKKSFEIQIKPYQMKYNAIMKKQRAIFSHSPNSNIPFDELVLKKMRSHKEKVKKLKDTIHDMKTAQQLKESEYEHQLFINKQKHKKNFQLNERKMNEEMDQLIKKRDELKNESKNIGFNDDNNENSNSLLSNQNHAQEKIDRLTFKLNKVNQKLTNLLTDYKNYKTIFESQENRFSSSFEVNQPVPMLQLTPTKI